MADVTEADDVQPGVIKITVDKETVGYDSNMSIPDMLFWMEAVKKLALEKALGTSKS